MLGPLTILLAASAAPLQPGEIQGAIYDLDDGQPGKKLFDIERGLTRTKSGWAATMVFRDAAGRLAVQERVEFDDQMRPLSFVRDQHQTGGRGVVRFEGNKILYEWRNAKGRVRRSRERTDESLMVGPMMFAYFQYYWPQIKRGETISFRIVVPDRRTSYRFEFEKVGEVVEADGRLAKCELRLTGFIGLFVGDMVFYLDAETGDIVRYTGMVLPKRRVGDDWEPVKGMVRYPRRGRTLAGPRPR